MRPIVRAFVAFLFAVLTTPVPGVAQSPAGVRVSMQDGRVTVAANQAPLALILAEWARVGGSTIVNGDTVASTPITIELNDVAEQHALQVLLRSTGGYVAVRRSGDVPGVSTFARIVILPVSAPTSSASTTVSRPYTPPPVVPPPAGFSQPIATQTPVVTRLVGANGLPVPDDQNDGQPSGITRTPPTPPTRIPSGIVGMSAPGMLVPAPQPATATAPGAATLQR